MNRLVLYAFLACVLTINGCKVSRSKPTMNLSTEEHALLVSKQLDKIAEFIGGRIIQNLPDFRVLPHGDKNCDYPSDWEIGVFCAQHIGGLSGKEVMDKLVELNRSEFLMPDPPYVWDSNARWYTTVWGIPATRFTFTLVYVPDWEIVGGPKISKLDISYTEDVTWEDLHPSR